MSDVKPLVVAEGRQIPFAEAKYSEMVGFAVDLGCDVKNGHTLAVIKTLMKAQGWEHDYIIVPLENPDENEIEPETSTAPLVSAGEAASRIPHAAPLREITEPMVTLQIQQQEGAGGKRPVFVAVNGIAMLIPRNRPVVVKLRYLKALEIAIQKTYPLDEDDKPTELDTPNVPFSVTVMPPPDVIDAWYAFEAATEMAERKRAREAARLAAKESGMAA